MKHFTRTVIPLVALSLALLALSGCGASGSANASAPETDAAGGAQARKITYAFTNTLKPTSYLDADGQPAGYDVEVIRAIDELLPQYEIEFVGTTSEDAWLGTQEGKYQLATTNSVRTAEREGIYAFADTNQGAFQYGLITRNEDAAKASDLKSLAESDLTVVPLRPADATYAMFVAYNEEHPDGAQLRYETIDAMENPDAIRYVAEGRYDVFPFASILWYSLVEDENGDLHDLSDKLTFQAFQTTPTYALINADEKEFRDAYQDALHTLKENGTISKLSQEYLGFDLLEFSDVTTQPNDPAQ